MKLIMWCRTPIGTFGKIITVKDEAEGKAKAIEYWHQENKPECGVVPVTEENKMKYVITE